MAGIVFTVDTGDLNRMSVAVARMIGQYEWIAARAMTEAAKAAKVGIEREILPMIDGGPTAWTRRGLIVKYARRDDLRAMVGFQYGEGRFEDGAFTRKAQGVAAGRYMGINARGGDRRPKSSELQLRRAGLIRQDQFLVPPGSKTKNPGVRLNAQGNLPGGQYQQILSRIKGFSAAGSNQNTTSASKRRQVDYAMIRYLGGRPGNMHTLGATPAFIGRRVGALPKGGTGKGSGKPGRPQTVGYRRGLAPAIWITDQPNYERRFPIQRVAEREFARAFPIQFERALDKELQFQRSRR